MRLATLPAMHRCELCPTLIFDGERYCPACKEEIEAQLTRMGIEPSPRPRQNDDAIPMTVHARAFMDELEVLGEQHLVGLVPVLVEIARLAGEISTQEADRAALKTEIVKLAYATGHEDTRDALLRVAAVAARFAERIPKRGAVLRSEDDYGPPIAA